MKGGERERRHLRCSVSRRARKDHAVKIRLLTLLTLVAIISLPAAAQVTDTYVVPAAANLSGNFGTRWMTQFSVFNPHLDYPLTVSVTYIPTGGGQGIEELIDIPANSLAYSDNILSELFEVSGGGALLVASFPEDNPGVPNDVLSRAFLVTSNTYNNASSGTYGQTIPGSWTGLLDFESDEISAVAHGIRNSTRTGWRTNVGGVNLGRCTATLRINVYDANGNKILNQAPLILPPLGHFQDSLPVQVEAGTVEFFLDDPCAGDDERYAVVFPYTSTIDQLSGDPTYQTPALLAPKDILALSAASTKTAAAFDPTNVGKKIDSGYARGVRALADRRGTAKLVRTEKGMRVTR